MDWSSAALVVGVVGGGIAIIKTLAQGVVWCVETWRKAKTASTPECLRGLSFEGRQLLNHIHSRTLTFAEHERRCPSNHPMNTNEASIAKGSVWGDLDERSLQAVMKIQSDSTFGALVKDLESRGLIEVATDDVFFNRHVFISELGLAVLSKKLPPELRPVNA